MSTKHQPRKVNFIIYVVDLLLVFLFLPSCVGTSPQTKEVSLNKTELLDGLRNLHDVKYFDELASYHFGIDCSMNEILSASLFAGDSLCYLPGYEILAEYNDGNIAAFYSAILLIHGRMEYKESLSRIVPIKHCLKEWINGSFRYDIENAQNIDSLVNLIMAVEDDSSYMALREQIPYGRLFPVAKSLTDEKGLASAACDVYLAYISSTYNYLAEVEVADTALQYLDKSVDCQFLPAVFYKSLLLLTGTYLPQDTITGRELLICCIDSTDCISFWRGKRPPKTIVME